MACEPIYSNHRYFWINFAAFFGLCRYRTQDGVAWEGDCEFLDRVTKFWTSVLIFLLGLGVVLVVSSRAQAEEFKPLTRDEPVVRMVLQEAAGEPMDGQIAVAGVAFDRVSDPRWPNTIRAVIYQPWQFTGMRYKLGKFKRVEVEQARQAVRLAKAGIRPCGRVMWYHAYYVEPSWMLAYNKHCRIGGHIFYGD